VLGIAELGGVVQVPSSAPPTCPHNPPFTDVGDVLLALARDWYLAGTKRGLALRIISNS
jgi:hypothetical protein